MDCMKFQELLSDYANLTVAEKQLLEEHSCECKKCAEELEQYLSILQTLKSMPKLTAPEDFLADLNYRIDKEDIKQQTRMNLLTNIKMYSYRYGAVAACLALIAVIGINNTELVNKMNGASDGVISVVTSTIAPSAKPVMSAMPIVPSAEAQSTAFPESPSATKVPDAKSTKAPTTKAPETKTQTTRVPSAKAPLATAVPNRNNNRPLATPIPQPVRATLSPTVIPDVNISISETQKVDTYDVTYSIGNEPEITAPAEVTEAPLDNTGIAVASMVEKEPEGLVLNPDEYQLPDNINARTVDNKDDVSRYTASSNSIEVSYASADKAKEIINEYSISNDGEYYSVSSEKMEEFLQAMSDAGIEYADNCVEVGADTITFRLIIS